MQECSREQHKITAPQHDTTTPPRHRAIALHSTRLTLFTGHRRLYEVERTAKVGAYVGNIDICQLNLQVAVPVRGHSRRDGSEGGVARR